METAGSEYEHVLSPDRRCWASIYSQPYPLLPVIRHFQVVVPSQRDLKLHVVFEKLSFTKRFTIRWASPYVLEVVCAGCSETALAEQRVDDVQITMVKQ